MKACDGVVEIFVVAEVLQETKNAESQRKWLVLNPEGNNKAKDQESDSRNQRTKQIIAKSAEAGNRGEASKFD